MKQKNTHKIKILVISMLLVIAVGAVLLWYNQEGFTGNRIKNPDSYILDIEKMNGTDLHTLEVQADDVLQIHFETVKGSLYMEIGAPDGTKIYRGNGLDTTDFTVKIPESGVYTVVVAARHAKGTIHIQCVQTE